MAAIIENSAEWVARVDRSSSAERAAGILRRGITEGALPPGAQLFEIELTKVLEVSRNTLRGAFRLLTDEGLLVYKPHRGVFMPELDERDVVDLYRLRRVADRWAAVGTANMPFHQHLIGLAGSPRMAAMTGRLLAELRLLFHVIAAPRELHEPYIEWNRRLLELLEARKYEQAADDLHQYCSSPNKYCWRHSETVVRDRGLDFGDADASWRPRRRGPNLRRLPLRTAKI